MSTSEFLRLVSVGPVLHSSSIGVGMIGLLKKRRARFDLDVALQALLLGEEEIYSTLKKRYKERWGEFVRDITSGVNKNDSALSLVTMFLIEEMRHITSQAVGALEV